MVFGWLIPSLFVMTIAASLAELTSAMPYVVCQFSRCPGVLNAEAVRALDCITSRRSSHLRAGPH